MTTGRASETDLENLSELTCTCAALRRAARRVTQHYDAGMRSSGLRLTQFSMLMNVSRNRVSTLTRLAERMAMDRTTLTRNLRPLERQGLIAMRRGDDRRARQVELTATGRNRLRAALPYWERAEREFRGAFGSRRTEGLHTLLAGLVRLTDRHPISGE